MNAKTKKLALIGCAVCVVGAGVALALQAFSENLVFFFRRRRSRRRKRLSGVRSAWAASSRWAPSSMKRTA